MTRSRFLSWRRLPWLSLPVLAALAASAGAQAAKLNGALARRVDSDVIDYVIAPGGSFVVLRADATVDGQYDLYATPATGGAPPVRLNDPLPAHASVGGAVINVFGAGGGEDYGVASTGRVVYLADLALGDIDELFSVPVDRSQPPVRLNGTLLPGASVQRFWILPAGQGVLYLAEQAGASGLFRVPIDGTGAATPLTPGVLPQEVWVSPDGATALYSRSSGFPGRTELWSVPTDGSAAPQQIALTRPPTPFGFTGIEQLCITDDGARAVYRDALFEFDLVNADLLSVPLDGSQVAVQLNQSPLDPFDTYSFEGLDHVLFREGSDLIFAPLDGGQRVNLTPAGWIPEELSARTTVDGSEVWFAARSGSSGGVWRWGTDGAQSPQLVLVTPTRLRTLLLSPSHVVTSTLGAPSEFVSTPVAGGASQLLNPSPYDEGAIDARLHPDGDQLLFRAQPGGRGRVQLYSVPLDASALPLRLNADLIPAGDVQRYDLSDDGALVVYHADQNVNEALELFGLPFAGGPVETYNPPLDAGPVLGDVQSFLVCDDESQLLYHADQDQDQVFDLYLTRPDGRAVPRSLTSTLAEGRSVFPGAAFTPDSGQVAFLRAESPGSASGHLFSIPVAPPSTPILLDDRGRIYAQSLVVDPLGTRVVYRRQRTLTGDFYDLCSVRVDGACDALTLTPASGTTGAYRLSADGSAAIYLGDHDASTVVELWRVPLDGSAPAAKLHPDMPASADVSGFALTPDGQSVVFLADPLIDQQVELFVVASDGSGPPMKRSGPLVASGDVTDFLVAPGGSSVVYRASQNEGTTFELFGFPLAGGPAVLLTPLATGRRVEPDFVVSADGQQVVYRANANAPGVVELFRVPLDASAAPTRLSAALVTGGNVLDFKVASDANWVVYRADQRLAGVRELHSVPLAGGPVKLLQALPLHADVTHFAIAPDSAHVHFRVDRLLDGVHAVHAAPLDGSAPARRMTLLLPPWANVEDDFVPLSGGRVLHRVDHEANGVVELYLGFLERSQEHSARPTSTVLR